MKYIDFNLKKWFSLVAFLCLVGSFTSLQAQSVLSEGIFYKMRISQTGIHKITFQDLQAAGINPNEINPRQIQIFGNGGGMLPQLNSAERQIDLVENAIEVVGEADGRFDAQDYILFYAENAHQFRYDASLGMIRHEQNIYDDFNYYFLTFNQSEGKRLTAQADTPIDGEPLAIFDEIKHYEKDDINVLAAIRFAPGGSGRDWYGELFELQRSHTIRFETEGMVAGEPLKVHSAVMALSSQASTYQYAINGAPLGSITMQGLPISTYTRKGDRRAQVFEAVAPSSNRLEIGITYERQEDNAFGYLDFVSVQYKRALRMEASAPLYFRSVDAMQFDATRFDIESNRNIRVWNLKNPLRPQLINVQNSSGNRYAFYARTAGSLIEFAAFHEESEFLKVENFERLENQDLRSLPTPNLLILTHVNFQAAAERLAEFRRSHDGLAVQVVRVDKVYNEFSSGKQDLTALRDFIKFLYEKSDGLRYVLLYGDASFDYKGRMPNDDNFVPIYQSRESLHPVISYSSDDYIGFLEPHEGIWEENSSGNDHDMEVGIGRLPVRTLEQAEQMVDKLIHYSKHEALGDWRNRIDFYADDGDNNTHLIDTERLVELVDSSRRAYDIRKYYIDAFPKEVTSTGRKSPIVREKLNRSVERGALIVNYMGHGSESGWASEEILQTPQISRWNNLTNMPLFITATCEFGRYDNPNVNSGGELAMLNPRGGAISLLTTTRPVYSNTNYLLARNFYTKILEPLPSGEMPRLGDVIRRTKNKNPRVENRNFALLGDPSLRIAYPQEQVVVRSMRVNGTQSQQITAKGHVVIEGEVQHMGNRIADFNGTVTLRLFDNPVTVRTLGDDAPPIEFPELQTVLFRGTATVEAGRFRVEFYAPKNIEYKAERSKISFYAAHNTQIRDAHGYQDVFVGGSSEPAPPINEMPTVKLYMDSEAFQHGGRVRSSAVLIADFETEYGMDISGLGIGQNIEAVLNDEQIFVLNEYYFAEQDNFRKGRVLFPLSDLPTGRHRLKVSGWDVMSNYTEAEIEFVVENDPVEVKVVSYPNPFSERTQIRITHNRAGEDIEVSGRVYNAKGQLVRNLRNLFVRNSSESFELMSWDGREQSGAALPNGMYILRIQIRSLFDDKVELGHYKLVLMR
ncbi:MAG: type IX secretion system sortase PorU [Bernardetiaceae bacterium]|nr:type IX secretion system sortase PorU [Bernardetiaceae bacterium]